MTVSVSPEFSRRQRFVLAVVPRLTWAVLRLLGLTWRFEVIAEEGASPVLFGNLTQPEIYCFWHQCVLPCDIYFRRSRAVLLISQSFDGELITRTPSTSATRPCAAPVRGAHVRRSWDSDAPSKAAGRRSLPPMGPAAPSIRTKMGPVKLAQMTGAPIGAFHLQPEHAGPCAPGTASSCPSPLRGSW